jgi:uncharacterized RDD family membrane protein YckC
MPVSEESPRPQTATDFPVVGANSLASALERGAARLIDVLIAAVPTLVIFIVWAMGHDPAVDTFPTWPRFVFVGVAVVYEAAFVAWRGQTLGKIIVGVRVALLVNGAKPSGSQAAMRALVPGAAISSSASADSPSPQAELAEIIALRGRPSLQVQACD